MAFASNEPHTVDSPKPQTRGVTISIALLFLATVVGYIDRAAITVAIPYIGDDLSLGKGEQGLVLSIFYFAYALTQVPAGLLADRFGAKKLILIALVAWSLFTGLTAVAVGLVTLLAIRLIFGVSEGAFTPASFKAITERTPRRFRSTASGIMLTSNPIGLAAAPLIAAPLIIALDWRGMFWALAGIGIVVAAVVWKLLPRRSSDAVEQSALGHPATETTTETDASWNRPAALLRVGLLWRLAILFGAFNIVTYGIVSWIPSYLLDRQGGNLGQVGVLVSISWVVATVFLVLGGILFDRYFHRRPRMLIIPALAASGAFLVLMTTLGDRSTTVFVVFEVLAMVGFVAFMPIFGLPLRMLPSSITASATAMVNTGGQLAGACSPFLMGLLVQEFSYAAAFQLLPIALVIAIAVTLTIPRTADEFANRVRRAQE